MRSISLRELGALVGAEVIGDGEVKIRGIAGIGEAGPGDVSFVANPKYVQHISSCRASAIIVGRDLSTEFRPLLVADDPYLAFTHALRVLQDEEKHHRAGIHERAIVAPTVRFGENVTIMANAVIEDDVSIGDNAVIYPGVFIGRETQIGANATIYANVSICEGSRIGDDLIIHGGTRLTYDSSYGARTGRIVIGNDVELGANVTVSAGGRRDTVIARGTKVDNLVSIRPGAQLGENCIVVAQVTVGENADIEERVTLAGQVVICPEVRIGARAMVGAKSYVDQDLAGGTAYSGTPAQPHMLERRMHAGLRRIPELRERLGELEKRANITQIEQSERNSK